MRASCSRSGSTADFVRNYPARLPYNALDVEIPLRHFSPAAMQTFLLIERPQHLDGSLRSEQGWTSIGQFYDFIRQGLLALVTQLGEDTVFCGRPERQVGPADFYNSGGETLPVTDLTSALLALRVITEQGEGLRDSLFDSDGIDPKASVAQYARYDKAVYEHAVAFHDAYAELLTHLEIAFNGRPRVMILGIPAMLRLRDLAEQLYRKPERRTDVGANLLGFWR